jgi:hypothetical protein
VCDIDLANYLIIQGFYMSIISARNLSVLVTLCLTKKKPQRVKDISNIIFVCIDLLIIPIATVYGTKTLFNKPGLACRDNGDPNTFNWWVISLLFLIFGWVYSIFLALILTSVPLLIFFWCFYQMQLSEIANESRIN